MQSETERKSRLQQSYPNNLLNFSFKQKGPLITFNQILLQWANKEFFTPLTRYQQ